MYEKLGTFEELINMKGSTKINDEIRLYKQLTLEEAQINQLSFKEISISRIEEILMTHMGETRNCSDIIIDNIFAFQVAMDIMRNDEDQEPQFVDEC